MSEKADKRSATCVHCGASYRVPLSKQGKPAKCPKCQKTFRVQFNTPQPASSSVPPQQTAANTLTAPPRFRQPIQMAASPNGGPGLISLPLWILIVVCTIPPLVFLVAGYFAGREHLKYQMRTAVQEAGRKFAEGMRNAFNPDRDEKGDAGGRGLPEPAQTPRISAGEEYDAGIFSVAVIGTKLGQVTLKGIGDTKKVSENPLLMIALKFTNNDLRKALSFRGDRMGFRRHFHLKDDVGNVVRPVNFGMMSEVIGSIEDGEQLKPESTLTHIEVFDKPLPKTEKLILTVDLKVFGGDGELEIEIPIDSVVGFEE